MRPISPRFALLAAAVLSTVPQQARAAPENEPPPKVGGVILPLKGLTQEKLRKAAVDAVKASRANPLHDKFWNELDKLVEVEPGRIVYEHDKGLPLKVVWEAKPTHVLTEEERVRARYSLRKVFDSILFGQNLGGGAAPSGPLLSNDDARVLLALTHFKVVNPGAKPPRQLPRILLKELNQEKFIDWLKEGLAAGEDDLALTELWRELDEWIVVDPEKIIYEQSGGVPTRIVWQAFPRRPLTADERIRAEAALKRIFDYAIFTQGGGIVDKSEFKHFEGVVHLAIAANPAANVADEVDRLRRENADLRALLERLRNTAGARPTGSAGEPRRYLMVIQPSSMIYYDCCNMVWVQGPASVAYYPVDTTNAPRRQRPAAPPTMPPPSNLDGGNRPPAPLMPPAGLDGGNQGRKDGTPGEADRLFWVGYRSYWQGDYDKALVSFDGAIRIDDGDARFWYYKALTERALGDVAGAEASVQRGRGLHAGDRSKAGLVSAALERVQGAERRFLNAPEIIVVSER